MLTQSDNTWFAGSRAFLLEINLAALKVIDNNNVYDDTELTEFEKLVVLLEDKRFIFHSGIDYRSVLRALWKIVILQPKGGASTIEMQLIRTVTGRYERDVHRKAVEIFAARIVAAHLTKKQIIRQYMRVAYFGTGLIGSQKAFERELRHPADGNKLPLDRLTAMVAIETNALIASQLVYPRPRSGNADWLKKVRRRANYGIELLSREQGSLDKI